MEDHGASPADHVLVAVPRHALRARRHPDGGLIVEVRVHAALSDHPRRVHADPPDPWRRVDADLVALARAVTRHLALDPVGATRFSRDAAALAGVEVRDAGPIAAVLRATYPLLAAIDPWPLPALPGCLPAAMQSAFRMATPRDAARALFGSRATRPVARALAWVLTAGGDPLDLFRLSVARAACDHLEPDHLVRVLQAPAPLQAPDAPVPAGQRDPLSTDQAAMLAALAATLRPRVTASLLAMAMADGDDRRRLRFVVDGALRGQPVDLAGVRSWRQVSTAVALATPDVDALLPAGADTQVDHRRWELRLARTGRDLVRLSRQLHNCLDTYVGALGPHDRIVEVVDRTNGRPAYAIHLRRGHLIEFQGPRNHPPGNQDRDDILRLLDAHGRFTGDDQRRKSVRDTPDRLVGLAQLFLHGPRRPDWAEVGIAFWMVGLLDGLPDPSSPAGEQVVTDVADLLVTNGQPPAHTPRTVTDLERAIDALGPGAVPWTTTGMRRLAMLDAVRAQRRALVDHGRAGMARPA